MVVVADVLNFIFYICTNKGPQIQVGGRTGSKKYSFIFLLQNDVDLGIGCHTESTDQPCKVQFHSKGSICKMNRKCSFSQNFTWRAFPEKVIGAQQEYWNSYYFNYKILSQHFNRLLVLV